MNRIHILQKKALRIINGVDSRTPSNPLFFNHKSLKVCDIYLLQLGTFMYQFTSNVLPNSLHNMFIMTTQIHSHHTRQSGDFYIPHVRLSKSINYVSFQGPKFWNALSNNLKNQKSVYVFKKKLKLCLLEKYSRTP